ncbi:hypothetical protein OHB41_27405 [Streptomyces sp. NBC_01571]|uniref:hypothetical protein n=1 Tax=Streptomyces sp. NBC_01571 TaxID=2975883 RepID=UPI0022571289|nr:hypothetical protein [Streptomyces sp. NBC_01571]MCX4576833.1 hypothetical protein [Streptomyces sp. NBC_01571]
MNETLMLDGLTVPMRALRLLATDFGFLPAPHLHVSPVYPDRLTLSLHEGLPDFEAWRDALGIAPETVTCRAQANGVRHVLCAFGSYAGAELELVGYGDVPIPAREGGGDAVLAS